MRICVIPARGGSKRIPRKNIREFCGKPMLAWSIIAAQESGCFDHIIVSTDDNEIADVARKWDAEVPFNRPEDLADDFVGTRPVVAHAVQWYLNLGHEIEAVCCLYATAPFVGPNDIVNALSLLEQSSSDFFVFTATKFSSPIQRALRIDPVSGEARMWQPDNFTKRSQDLEPAYHDAGQLYWARPQTWLQDKNLFECSKPLIMPLWRVQDIDTQEDWINAELMLQTLTNRNILANL